ncbi:cytosolic carboxypeptidase 6 [Diorhabda sublineata]|uniref:cytosolic carboxypeptidase 6 n=1 Tax=Diorhabda sublineata TaxID=1163346 RepID=UPI0024E0D8E1|nr:cytosolic carboxypeptidase 6 [Diorhabda sublineata]
MGDFGEDSDDSDGEGGMGNVSRIIMRPPGHSGKAKKGHLCFDASFETGNLGRVDLINEYEYDLFIRPDTCSPKLRFWFNFTVDNVKQDQRVIFNIVNISKDRNLFMENMTPLVKSSSRPQWQRIPKQYVFYHKSALHHGHYVLSFSFGFDKEDDLFQFCLAPPYSYSRLQTFSNVLEKKAAYLTENFKKELLEHSVQKRRIDLITIGSLNKNNPNSKRRVIAIMARVHPGESPSSFVCQGLLELLISSNYIATTLREHVIFKVIPMLNPDGVFLGNYRSTVIGTDLNRSWHISNQWCHPALRAVIDMLMRIDKNKEFQLDFVIDIHAHSSLKGCFMYGNSYEDVYRYERHILFPKLLANTSDDYVPENTMFNSDINKIGTARRYLCSILSDRVNCYTFEVSIYGYKLKTSDNVIPYTEDTYMRCGRNLVKTFLEYYHNTGAIPILLGTEIVQKKQKPRLKEIRRRNKKRLQRPLTSRTLAELHFKNLNICDYDTSFDELTFSHRHATSHRHTFNRLTEQLHTKEDNTQGGKNNTPLSPTTYVVLPEPSLSIIDFNLIIREDINAYINQNQKKKCTNLT